MMIPTIHRNGTSKDELQQQIADVTATLRAAEQALQAASPNGRDYYPQGSDAIHKATDEARDRAMRLRGLREEFETIAEAIFDGGHKHA